MDSFIIACNAELPMFILICFGFYLSRVGWLSDHIQKQMTRLIYSFFIPAMVFYNIVSADLHAVIRPKMILFIITAVVILWLVILLFTVLLEKDFRRRGALVQGILRSNYTLFGMSLLINMFGADKVGLASFTVAIVIPAYNTLSIITLESFRGGRAGGLTMLKNIALNPLIISCAISILILLLSIDLPAVIDVTIESVARIATPIALMIMGSTIRIGKTIENKHRIITAVTMRLIAVPLFVLTAAILLGFRDIELAVLMSIFTAPTAIVAFPTAQQLCSDGELTAEIIVFSTVFSCLTVFLWIFVLTTFGYISCP